MSRIWKVQRPKFAKKTVVFLWPVDDVERLNAFVNYCPHINSLAQLVEATLTAAVNESREFNTLFRKGELSKAVPGEDSKETLDQETSNNQNQETSKIQNEK